MLKLLPFRRVPLLLRPQHLRFLSSAPPASPPFSSHSTAPSATPLFFKGVREFSVKAPPKEDHIEVPIPVYGLAGRYASALYVVAMRANALEPILEELNEVVAAAQKSSTFDVFLKDPSVPTAVRIKAMLEIFAQAGFSDITVNFLGLLAENGRLAQLSSIVDCFIELVRAYRGEVKATVTATIKLSAKEMEQLKSALKRFIKPGQTVILDQKIDRNILGGLVVDIGEKHIDLSVATKVKQVEKLLSEPI